MSWPDIDDIEAALDINAALNTGVFADPYKKCSTCGHWVDGVQDAAGGLMLVPCGHRGDYQDVCPSWSPVSGCGCAEYSKRHPDQPIVHEMRPVSRS
jgi:hypothetical protein